MGTFSVTIQVGDLAGQNFVDQEALVDTGSSDTVLPRDLLEGLGITPAWTGASSSATYDWSERAEAKVVTFTWKPSPSLANRNQAGLIVPG